MGTRVLGLGLGSLAKPPSETLLAYRASTLAPALPEVHASDAWQQMPHGLTDLHGINRPTPRPSKVEPVALGQELVEWIQNDIHLLKPKMRRIAEHLLRHSTSLHLEGIRNLAQQTHAAPATIVRLAKRYGFTGFSDLKVAFLRTQPTENTAETRQLEVPLHSPPAHQGPGICGSALIARIRQDLPRLSPKMRNVGEHLLRQSSTLHQQRIKALALQAHTIPATIVRLAKRYGFIGFHDLKLAFLPNAATASPEANAALAELDRWALHMQSIRAVVEHASFQQVLLALHAAPQIAVCPAQPGDRAVASHLANRLAALKLCTTLTGPEQLASLVASAPAQSVVLEVCLGGHSHRPRTTPRRYGNAKLRWISMQTSTTPQANAQNLSLTIPGAVESPSNHGAFALVAALYAALHARATLQAPASLPADR
jgi:DNA-binding MurR/RpiR family transcriptional regulator